MMASIVASCVDANHKYDEYQGFINEQMSQAVGDMQQLKFVSYEYKGIIKSERHKQKIINDIFGDDSPIFVLTSEITLSDTIIMDQEIEIRQKSYPQFEIMTIRQARETGKVPTDSLAAMKQRVTENLVSCTEIFNIHWNYKGKDYHTTAVSNNGAPTDLIHSFLSIKGSTTVKSRY